MNTEKLAFVSMAVSKDESRHNLTGVYRDSEHYVATDGHRLHRANGLPKAAPHYLDDRDAEFPDYRQVMPKVPRKTGEFTVNGQVIKALRHLVKYQEALTETKGKVFGRFYTDAADILVEIKGHRDQPAMTIKVATWIVPEGQSPRSPDLNVGLNFTYFLDAVEPLFKAFKRIEHHLVQVDFDGELAPILLTHALGEAVIMPVRLDRI